MSLWRASAVALGCHAGRLETITRGNGATTVYTYDEVNRVATITHEDGGSGAVFTLAYDWTLDNNVASRSEADWLTQMEAVVVFTYDARDRLTGEQRSGWRVVACSRLLASRLDAGTAMPAYMAANGCSHATQPPTWLPTAAAMPPSMPAHMAANGCSHATQPPQHATMPHCDVLAH